MKLFVFSVLAQNILIVCQQFQIWWGLIICNHASLKLQDKAAYLICSQSTIPFHSLHHCCTVDVVCTINKMHYSSLAKTSQTTKEGKTLGTRACRFSSDSHFTRSCECVPFLHHHWFQILESTIQMHCMSTNCSSFKVAHITFSKAIRDEHCMLVLPVIPQCPKMNR